MAELADALDSGSSESNFMEVQVLLPAPNSRNPNPKPVGEGFGFLFVFGLCFFTINLSLYFPGDSQQISASSLNYSAPKMNEGLFLT